MTTLLLGLFLAKLAAASTGALLAEDAQPSEKAGTKISDPAELKMLLGTHPFALQWISWSKFGRVVVRQDNGRITLSGAQEDRKNENYIRIDGVISEVAKGQFRFQGTIVYRVTHLNQGRECKRKGTMLFRRRGKRKYWRCMQMDNPCDGVTDYIDVYTHKI